MKNIASMRYFTTVSRTAFVHEFVMIAPTVPFPSKEHPEVYARQGETAFEAFGERFGPEHPEVRFAVGFSDPAVRAAFGRKSER